MSSSSSSSSGGIGFAGLLTIAFIVLKLCGVIDWPWIWVLAPAWISIGLAILIIVIALLIAWRVSVGDERRRQDAREARRPRPYR